MIVLVVPLLAGCAARDAGTAADRSGVAGRVHLGPQCPVETEGDPCDDKPSVGTTVTVAEQRPGSSDGSGEVVARTTTDAHGAFRVAVPPGTYVVTAQAGMSCEPVDLRVASGAYAKADLSCDTGIR